MGMGAHSPGDSEDQGAEPVEQPQQRGPSASRIPPRPHLLGATCQAHTHEMPAPTAMGSQATHGKWCVRLAHSEH